jgi:predicted AlkP superfamily phosphohydrolase/phosphomutase
MAERPPDLLTVILYELDRLQHRFWRHLSGTGPYDADPAIVAEITNAARASYRCVDASVGELVRAAGPDTITFVVSDHGFGPAPERFVFVNRWLADHGFLHVRRSWRLRRRLVKKLPAKLRVRFDTIERIFLNWSRTRAWCDAMETRSAGIWLNVRGRQPQGVVEPGAEYERVREEIRQGLSGLQDGGRPVFSLVARREDVYHGPAIELAPDLLLYANPSHGVRFNGLRPELRARSPFADFQEFGFTGAHEPAGIYVAAGPGIAALGRQPPKPIEALAPTIISLLGLPIPDGMDAEPLLDFLTADARAATRVSYVPDADPPPPSDGEYDSADQAQIEARLRALGYVE